EPTLAEPAVAAVTGGVVADRRRVDRKAARLGVDPGTRPTGTARPAAAVAAEASEAHHAGGQPALTACACPRHRSVAGGVRRHDRARQRQRPVVPQAASAAAVPSSAGQRRVAVAANGRTGPAGAAGGAPTGAAVARGVVGDDALEQRQRALVADAATGAARQPVAAG